MQVTICRIAAWTVGQ